MEIRKAIISDVAAIHELINHYAEFDRMLFRSVSDIYENLQIFHVAVANGKVVGCGALQVIWSDLAEIKSLAVAEDQKGKGIGRYLVNSIITHAKSMGLPRVFALTLEPEFFSKLGFSIVNKAELPMKVWSDCAKCPKQDECDEIAVLKQI